jgi:hypothetical protein
MEKDPLTERIIGCAIEVHRNLGPGSLESAYESCLYMRLAKAEIGWLINFNVRCLVDGIKRFRL